MPLTKLSRLGSNFLRWLGRRIYAHPAAVLTAALLLAILGSWLTATRLGYQTNPNDLLKPDEQYHQKFLDYVENFRQEEDFILVVGGPDFERNRDCVEYIASRLKADPEFGPRLFYKINFSTLEDRMLLYVDEKELKGIDSQLEVFGKIMGQSGWQLDLNTMLDTAQRQLDPDYMEEEGNWEQMQPFLEDFISNLNRLADRLEGREKGIEVGSFGNLLAQNSQVGDLERQKAEHEYITFNNGRIMLLTVRPPEREKNADFFPHAKRIERFRQIIEEARANFPGLDIGLTGEPVLAQDEMATSTRDSSVATGLTLVLIVILFSCSYREFWRPCFAVLTLLIAVTWTMGFAAVSVGHLNILSQAFVAMNLGLGIDFGIQIIGRYEEELARGRGVCDAVQEVLATTGSSVITGGGTTAAAFYTMCFNQFTGLAELGIIAGSGVLLCLVAALTVLPAMLILRDRRRANLADTASAEHWGSRFKVDRFLKRHAGAIAAVAGAATVLSFFSIPVADFDYNLLNLQSKNLESVRFERKLLDSNSQSVIFAVSIADDLEKTKELCRKYEKLPTVFQTVSVSSIIPEDQAARMAVIKKIRSRLEKAKISDDVSQKVNVGKARESLRQLKKKCERFARLSKQFGYEEESKVFEKLIPPIDRALGVFSTLSQSEVGKRLNAHQYEVFGEMQKNLNWLKKQRYDKEITEKDVPPEVRDRYVGKKGKFMIEIYPKQDVWERAPLAEFVHELRSVDPNVTGTPVQNYEYIELLKQSYIQAAVEALIAIGALILLHFRNLRLTLLTLLPLGLGLAWTLLAMPALGLRFNAANIITLPLVIGAGVAYGVYTVDRYRELGSTEIFGTSTGKAILLSALTTIFGFGSLMIATHRGIASLGTLMTLGIAMCLVAALYVLPALLDLSESRSKRKP